MWTAVPAFSPLSRSRTLPVTLLLLAGTLAPARALANDAPPAEGAADGRPADAPVEAMAEPAPAPRVSEARAVVVPVVVGGAAPPAPELLEALAEGLRENQSWKVLSGQGGQAFERARFAPLAEAERNALQAAVQAGDDRRSAGDAAAAATAYESALDAIEAAQARAPLLDEGEALLVRAGGGLVQALVASGDETRAAAAAERVALLLPGRPFSAEDGLSPVTLALLAAVKPADPLILELVSRPVGCTVEINGRARGRAPLKLPLRAGATYYMRALCEDKGVTVASQLRRIVPDGAAASSAIMLDAAFEKAFDNRPGLASGPVLRFTTGSDRRQLESAYARRIAEALGVEVVVLVSLGELGGSEWVNGRLYLSSGFRNRQGLARIETHRLAALGRYLASGKDSVEVLRSEEASELAARVHAGPRPLDVAPPPNPPWYTDVPGWVLTGVGVAAMGAGLWLDGKADDKRAAADRARMDIDTQQRLRADGQVYSFWSNVGLFGGGVMVVTGAIMLIAPEYGQQRSELFGLAPTRDGRGAEVSLSGRF